jgi:DNA-binding CsgD family transcriptional regulator
MNRGAAGQTAAARTGREADPANDDACEPNSNFDVLGHRFELVRQAEWLALDDGEMRRRGLRERACGRIRVAGEIHVIIASERVASDQPCVLQVLSRREFQIACQIAKGSANKDIARFFGISHLTVAEYVRRICYKLGVRSRSAIASSIGSMS